MKSALFCIGSPFQSLCAVEAMSYFKIEKYDFIVIDDGARLSQIEYFLKSKGVTYSVIPFHVSAYKSIIRVLRLLNLWSGKYDYLFMGDYRLTGNRLECIQYVKNGGKVYFLDDGNYVVNFAQGSIILSQISNIRNKLFGFFCKIRRITWKNFYTIYAKDIDLPGYNIVENNFKSLQTKSKSLSDDVYFIGTNPKGEGGYCDYLGIDYDVYLKTVSDILIELKEKNKTGKVYYIPHGRDLTNETKVICNRLGVIYKTCNVCIEMEIATMMYLPATILGFGSSALFTLHRMCPNTNIINLHIRGKNAKADKVYSQIDDMYNKVGISNQIINN